MAGRADGSVTDPEPRAPRAQLVVLVGPKGAGKTTLGRALAGRAGVHFLEVELLAQRVLAATRGVLDEAYAARFFDALRVELERLETAHDVLVIETTGASIHAEAFVAALASRHELLLVRVEAPADVCAARIRARDPSRQVAVSDDLIAEMHRRTEALRWPWDLTVSNVAAGSIDDVAAPIRARLRPAR